jgi:hypothetical protein
LLADLALMRGEIAGAVRHRHPLAGTVARTENRAPHR